MGVTLAQKCVVQTIRSWGWLAYAVAGRDYVRFLGTRSDGSWWEKPRIGYVQEADDDGSFQIDSNRLHNSQVDRFFFVDVKHKKIMWAEEKVHLYKHVEKGNKRFSFLVKPGWMSKPTTLVTDVKGMVATKLLEGQTMPVVRDQKPRAAKQKVVDSAQQAPSLKKVINHIYVQFQKEGKHRYPAALTDPKLADVKFLGYPHRHLFKFLVEIEVFHDDRDIEFIQFKRWLESLYKDEVLNLDYRSCEMISDELAEKISEKFPGRKIIIEVSEDGENGSRAVYIPA